MATGQVTPAFRSLALGTLGPGASAQIRFTPPLDLDASHPLVVSLGGRGTVAVTRAEPSEIVLTNTVMSHAPYWLIAVPRQLVMAAATDWGRLLQTLKARFLGGNGRP